MPKDDGVAELDEDKQPYVIRVWFPLIPGVHHRGDKNIGMNFVQLDPNEVQAFIKSLNRLKREGRILDFVLSIIQKYWTAKAYLGLIGRFHGKKRERKRADRRKL
jgi:hypothetical protein